MRVSTLATALTLMSFQAHADWQFTKWGMTPEEVIIASSGTATPLPPAQAAGRSSKEEKAILHMPYEAGQFKFEATFRFKGDKLCDVSLELVSGNSFDLARAIRDKYGVPVRDISRAGEGEWVSDGDHVLLYALLGTWTIDYFPSPLTDSKGL